MQILLTGSHGLIGSALVPLLRQQGHAVTRLVRRRPASDGEAFWDSARGELDEALVHRSDAIIHLSGESVAARWTPEKKKAILDSRVQSTRLLAQAVASGGGRQVLVCASAIGFYGDRGDDVLPESEPAGSGFLAQVCREWEEAAEPARASGARVVHGRIGVVLSPQGGALKALLPPFRLGVGGPISSGQQWSSWISLVDVARALAFCVENEGLSGSVNLVSPHPVRNKELARTLGRVLGRPAFLPTPPLVLRAMLGQAADEMLLFSQRVQPQVLETSGFQFEHAELEPALRAMLK